MRRGLRFIDEITKKWQHFLPSYFKILSVDPAVVRTRDNPHDSPMPKPPVRGAIKNKAVKSQEHVIRTFKVVFASELHAIV